ncbi:MAG: hypothetical protein JW940_28265, partial [Polyangiaceae bacterium]|nr:hypothetical protein [Polyangiaceae bacterium]
QAPIGGTGGRTLGSAGSAAQAPIGGTGGQTLGSAGSAPETPIGGTGGQTLGSAGSAPETPIGGTGGQTLGSAGSAGQAPTGGSGGQGEAGAGGMAGIELPFDTMAGCRNFTSPGCDQCCDPYVREGGVLGCNTLSATMASSLEGACPQGCPPCARCMDYYAEVLTEAAAAPRPECDCDSGEHSIDPCYTPDSCDCFCSALNTAVAMCPTIAAEACTARNQCEVALVAEEGISVPGQEVAVVWVNLSPQPIFLEPCAAYELTERWTEATLEPFADCPEGPDAVELIPGSSRLAPFTVQDSYPPGSYSVNGSYRVGCDADLPLDEANCDEGVHSVGSDTIGIAAE